MKITQSSVGMRPLLEASQTQPFARQIGAKRLPPRTPPQKEFMYRIAVKVDRHVSLTFVRIQISAPGAFPNDWDKYLDACRQNLYRVAAQESAELRVWSFEPDEATATIVHAVVLGGELRGVVPLHVIRALRPPPEYWTIEFLARGVARGARIEPMLKAYAEFENLKRCDRHGHRLQDPLPAQLLARALMEPGWRKLISPLDKPWAYINTATRRLYERHYQEHSDSRVPLSFEPNARAPHAMEDQLVVENPIEVFRAAGCTDDEMEVLAARVAGQKWHQLSQYLTTQTGHAWDARRVEAARGKLKRSQGKVRTAAIMHSHWKQATAHNTIYRERLPDGAEWSGSWTWSHTHQGEELEIVRAVMEEERRSLYSKE